MKVKSEEIILELNEFYENAIGVSVPYNVRRIEKDGEIVWIGLVTNWKYTNNRWYQLVRGEFVPSESPEYEKIYIEFNKK